MEKKNTREKIIGILLLVFAIGFNLWLYRLEPTATTDPNDNTFQYALVDRTNQMWDYANKTCSSNYLTFGFCHLSFLVDHWVPNWAEGYNLPYYYSHIPQIAIVASYRLSNEFSVFIRPRLAVLQGEALQTSLFQYYHLVIYLLLCFFPLSIFVSLRLISLSWLTAGVGALLASHLSTDGLYGLDPASFLWRGYGLSSQLFAMIWLPLAIAYAYKYVHAVSGDSYYVFGKFKTVIPNTKYLIPSIFFLVLTTMGHLGIGMIAFMSIGVLGIRHIKKLALIYGGVLLLLAYWIVPIALHGNYHNISFWDPVWKFDSYGAKETIIRLFNGDLFDFGRLPILTMLTFVGFFAALFSSVSPRITESVLRIMENPNKNTKPSLIPNTSTLLPFALLFAFWLLMYFGRTTWGPLIDLIPGMKEFHLSRFIVGLHIAGLFLIPIGVEYIVLGITNFVLRLKPQIPNTDPLIRSIITGITLLILLPPIYSQTVRYSSHNDTLIKQANTNFSSVQSDADSLRSTLYDLLSTRPGRVFAGRGGSWGRAFRVAETPYYMYLSTYGIPVVLWLPQTWSPNADTEQYFSEDQAKDYALYNIRYVVTPLDQKAQPFWKLIKESPTWKLYEVSMSQSVNASTNTDASDTTDALTQSQGYITTGVRPAIVSVDKTNFINVIRLWIQSDDHTEGLYPELTFDKDYPKTTGLPNFRMLDEVMYQIPDLPAQAGGTKHNLFAEPPRYETDKVTMKQCNDVTISDQKNEADMMFRATIVVKETNENCLVILRQTFHPSWKATVDGKPAETMTVFPFYTAVKLENSGTHEVVFTYRSSPLKIFLLILAVVSLIAIIWIRVRGAR